MAPRTPTTQNKEKTETQGPPPDPTQALSAAIEILDEEFEKLNIWGKVATIAGYLGRIPKNGWNSYNSYAYVLESDLVEHVRYWLAAARILIYPETFREHTVHTFEGSAAGGGRQRDALTDNIVVYRVTDGRTGESFTFEVNGQGADPRDKGANKASTSAMKFAYMRLFNISSGDDAEADSKGDEKADQPLRPAVAVTPSNMEQGDVQRGGKLAKASGPQIKQISNLSNTLNLGAVGLASVIKKVLGGTVELGDDETTHGPALAAYLKEQSGEDVGKLIYALTEMTKAVPTGDAPSGDPYP